MPDGNLVVHVGLDSSQKAVSAALDDVCQRLKPIDLSEDDRSTVQIVLAEVLNNVVEHAYESRPGNTVELWVKPQLNTLHCKVTDNGTPIPQGQLPQGTAADVDVDAEDLPEGGFGWFLIRALAKDITYQREKGLNILCFAILINQ